MFVEGEVEIKIKDATAYALDEHELKLWLHRSFKDMACYRISHFHLDADKQLRAVVALKLSVAPEDEQRTLLQRPNDAALWRGFIERLFVGRGSCRCVGEPKLRQS